MANPSPPASSYVAMHIRAGYATGAALTQTELDAACALLLANDGATPPNCARIGTLQVGPKGFVAYDGGSAPWLAKNAFTIDNGANWYPFDESSPSIAFSLGAGVITFWWSGAMGGDGAIAWQSVFTIGQFGGSTYSRAITHVTATGNTSVTPSYPTNRYRDAATLAANKSLTLLTANAFDGMEVTVARNGSSGGFTRNVLQNDGVTLIKAIADSFTGRFVYDGAANLWYLESYAPCL